MKDKINILQSSRSQLQGVGKMKNKYNYLWIGILLASIIGGVLLIKVAYANPLNLPEYALLKPGIKEAYSFAKLEGDKLEGLPCNCGCGTPEGAEAHGSRVHSRGLLDCFTEGDINNGGKWDQHASECGLCYEDALEAKKLYDNGKTKEEVKEALIKKYSELKFSEDTVYE